MLNGVRKGMFSFPPPFHFYSESSQKFGSFPSRRVRKFSPYLYPWSNWSLGSWFLWVSLYLCIMGDPLELVPKLPLHPKWRGGGENTLSPYPEDIWGHNVYGPGSVQLGRKIRGACNVSLVWICLPQSSQFCIQMP